MLKKERQALILREVNISNKVLHSDLAKHLNVSEDTIRRDLQELAEQGMLIKVRGGALSKSFHRSAYQENEIYSQEEKTIIARKAVSLIQDGMLVLIAGGMANLELARIIPPDLKATFFTNSLLVALQLLEHQNCETIFLGGRLYDNEKISVGGQVVQSLGQLQPDLCMLCTNGIDHERGLTDGDWEIVNVKQAMIKASKKICVLTVSDILGLVQNIQITDIAQVDYLITELNPKDNLLKSFHSDKLTIL